MAQRKIVWTKKANIERKEILEYWIYKNKSARFSKKLNLLFVESLKQICIYSNIGRKTSDEKTKVIIVRNYLIFYEFNEKEIIVQSVWDGRRDTK
ncbi:type II toxin-antitoxin system RelE/ParE family toxin [Chryseobacterium balustinum]|uniref:Plasmid stabilisation system protein n=1 Tax=Chryseobacterium balustinum TaxID=246 RepID=A0AAX2IPE8_9FLAO|nr:type II toxin-antitoxin system RelE/ParE family toxin [Chryseobacterium balustinum]AZB29084.1 type II toxin-antitoxin system RelE/ParE family toxin [Chryseobacterium balustinum]SKC07595.1 toxin YoeB [Chryseobacterium balustinum]SQA91665.1 Plasmid stabilisation system protein [Chryseobacterium balustinum]